MQQIGLRLDDDLLATIDRQRGDIPREVFIRRVLAASTEQIEERLNTAVSLGVQAVIQNDGRLQTTPRVHRPTCSCPVCKPPKKEKT